MKLIDIDFYRHFSLHISTFKLFGMWFYLSHPVKSFRFWVEIFMKFFLGITVFVIPTLTQLIYVIHSTVYGDAELPEISETLDLVITESLASVKLLDLFLRRDTITHLVDQLSLDLVITESLASVKLLDLFLRRDTITHLVDQLSYKEFQFYLKPQQDILEKGIRVSRNLFWGLIIGIFSDVIVHVFVVPGLQKFQVLPLHMDVIWIDLSDDKYFVYAYAYQVLYKPTILAVFIASESLPWAAMSFAISQLDVLIYNFENMSDLIKITMDEKQCDTNTAFKEVFRECVLHHCALIRYINTLQSAFGGQFTSALCLSGAIICTTGVQLFAITSPKSQIVDLVWILAYFVIFIFNLFIDCYFGNAITEKGLQLSTVVFNSPWTDLPNSLKKNVVIFMAMTQQPIIISAADFVPMSLETFTTVMNWTYKGFAIMNQMQD